MAHLGWKEFGLFWQKKCHVNHWTYMVHSWPSWKIAHESLHESHSTVGTTLFWLREWQVFIVIVSLGHSMWLMVLMFINHFLEVRVCTAPNHKNSKFWSFAPLWDSKRQGCYSFPLKVWRLDQKFQLPARKFKFHWCWCLLQSREQTILVICDK